MAVAVFTGAGASKAIGYPLTRELLPIVAEELKTGELFEDLIGSRSAEKRAREELYVLLKKLLPGFDTADQLPLITDIFSLVEYALLTGEALPIGGEDATRRLRDLLKQAITDVILGRYVCWNKGLAKLYSQQDKLRDRFVEWIESKGEFALITTNYDLGIESPWLAKPEIDLGFDWRSVGGEVVTRPRQPDARIYKLHGSLNLLRCSACGYVYFNPDGAIVHQAFKTKLDHDNTCDCRNDLRLDLHIVAPSFVREIRDANLLSVWRSALEWLRTAEEWVIVGYSLPPEDLAIRSLLIRAFAGAEKKPKITVVQHGCEAEPRYRVLFGKVNYVCGGLEAFLESAN